MISIEAPVHHTPAATDCKSASVTTQSPNSHHIHLSRPFQGSIPFSKVKRLYEAKFGDGQQLRLISSQSVVETPVCQNIYRYIKNNIKKDLRIVNLHTGLPLVKNLPCHLKVILV